MKLVDERYEVEKELGRGGMGVVYQALDVNLGRMIALKLIAPELVRDPTITASFQREAQALARVRSNHVVQIYAYGPHENSFFFAMELVEGVTLASVIDEHIVNQAVVPRIRSIPILSQLASGLDAVHLAGTVHRDVKPDNVIIEHGTGRPVLIDFGLAVAARAGSEVVVAGTPEYVAPEYVRGVAEITGRVDGYAFATLAFELLSGGHLPFKADSSAEYFKKHVTEAPRRMSAVLPELAALDTTFERALAKDPNDRFATCNDFVAEIEMRLEAELRLHWSMPRTSHPPQAAPQFNVLVVDDDPAFAKLVARAATIAFHGVQARIHVATSGADAVTLARVNPPSLLLLDYDMPQMGRCEARAARDVPGGVETLAQLRTLPRGEQMRVVVMSSAVERERWRFAVLGVEDFIPKPVSLPNLLKSLEAITAAAGWQRAQVPRRDSQANELSPDSRRYPSVRPPSGTGGGLPDT